ncbi:hypothetical protein ABVT39_010246 [Epinephelus coioides]
MELANVERQPPVLASHLELANAPSPNVSSSRTPEDRPTVSSSGALDPVPLMVSPANTSSRSSELKEDGDPVPSTSRVAAATACDPEPQLNVDNKEGEKAATRAAGEPPSNDPALWGVMTDNLREEIMVKGAFAFLKSGQKAPSIMSDGAGEG